jgi:HEAT repeat protein
LLVELLTDENPRARAWAASALARFAGHCASHSDIVAIKLDTPADDYTDAIAGVIPSLIILLNEHDACSKEEAASAIANLAVHGSSRLSIGEK